MWLFVLRTDSGNVLLFGWHRRLLFDNQIKKTGRSQNLLSLGEEDQTRNRFGSQKTLLRFKKEDWFGFSIVVSLRRDHLYCHHAAASPADGQCLQPGTR